jgi:drug/metabolite transporter (DMT)-like permease
MRRGVAYGVMAGAFWGSVFIAPRLLPEFSPLALSAGRYVTYGLVSLLAALPIARQLIRKVTRQDCIALIGLALTGNIVYYVLLSAAVQRVGIAPSSLIVGVLPVTVTLAGRRDHGAVAMRKLVWPLALVLGGIVCINLDVFTASATGVTASRIDRAIGLLCATGALLSWTWFAVANARYLKEHLRYNGNEWSVLSGVVTGLLGVLLGVAAMTLPGSLRQGPLPLPRWHDFWVVNLVLAVGASWLGNALWNAASKRLPLTLSGQMIVFETLFALLYGFIYDTRLPRLLEVAAIALLMFGVTWSVQLHASERGERKALAVGDETPLH